MRPPAGRRARAGGAGARAARPRAGQTPAVQRLGSAAAVSCAGVFCWRWQVRHVFDHAEPGPGAHLQKHVPALPALSEGKGEAMQTPACFLVVLSRLWPRSGPENQQLRLHC